MNPLHALQIVNDLALALVGEGEVDALTAGFIQRLLYHTGFAVALLAERPPPRRALTLAATIGNRDLAHQLGLPVLWLEALADGPSGPLADVVLAPTAFLGCERYRAGLRLRVSDDLVIVLLGPTAPQHLNHLPALFEPLFPRFARAVALTRERALRAKEIADELELRRRMESSLRASEAQARMLLDAAPHATFVFDLEAQRTVVVNALGRELLGLDRDELPTSSSIARRVFGDPSRGEELRLVVRRALLSAPQGTGPIEPVLTSLRRADGSERRVELHAQAVGTRAVVSVVDVTEHAKVGDSLRQARDAADRANEAKSSFLARMSHEMRTPLNAILGFAQLLETDLSVAESHRAQAGEIIESGHHLLALVDDVLDLARIEAGRVAVALSPVLLEHVVRESVVLVEVDAAKHAVSIALAPCEPIAAVADPTRLRQVLVNLLSNAVKYNVVGGRVEVVLEAVEGPSPRARLRVSDTGPGIPEKRLGELFTPFSRLGAELRGIDGSGIGLAVTKQLVELMGGNIGVESEEGVGTTFWIELPLADTPDGVAASGPRSSPRTIRGNRVGDARQRPRILIVEDMPMNQRLLGLQLEQVGSFDVVLAQHGGHALERWLDGDIDLVLTDCDMPFFDGYALATAMREHEALLGCHVPILAVTASAMKEDIERCLHAGMDACLSKPLSAVSLGEAIERWLPEAGPAPGASPHRPDARRDRRKAYLQALGRTLGPGLETHGAELLGRACASIEELIEEGRRHVGAGHSQDVGKVTHKLRTSSALIGATVLATFARSIERAGADGDLLTIRELWPLLEAAWHRVKADLAEAPVAPIKTPLPLARPEPLTSARTNITALRSRPEVGRLRGLRALVIDDDPLMRGYVSDLLSRLGLAGTLVAADGREGIERVRANAESIDLVLVDLAMPGMDGVEVLRHLAAMRFQGSVVLMSGAEERVLQSVDELAREHGFNVLGTLRKPFGPEVLATLLAQHRPMVARRTRETRLQVVSAEEVAQAIAAGVICPAFQPKVSAASLAPIGVEALARWTRADGTSIPPGMFVRVAEANGLADALFQSIFRQSLESMRRLDEFGHPLKMSVNVSASSLTKLEIAEFILDVTADGTIDRERIVLEITESGLVSDLRVALDVLNRLRLHGIGLSIDDFGTGYSSIDLLRRVPFTELKVDRSFVMKAVQDAAARHIIASSVGMARGLALRVVAEGVENEAELKLIRELGCDEIQGYLVARPMPELNLMAWLKDWRGVAAAIMARVAS